MAMRHAGETQGVHVAVTMETNAQSGGALNSLHHGDEDHHAEILLGIMDDRRLTFNEREGGQFWSSVEVRLHSALMNLAKDIDEAHTGINVVVAEEFEGLMCL